MNEGKLQRDAQGNYCLAHGERIPIFPRNTPWVQKIDDFYTRFPNIAAAAMASLEPILRTSANLIEVKEKEIDASEKVTKGKELDAYIAALQKISQPEEEEEDLDEIIKVLEACTRRKCAEESFTQGPQEKRMGHVIEKQDKPLPARPAPVPVVIPMIPKTSEPQYQFRAPCEDQVKPSDVLGQILGQTVVLSVEELLALCPNIHRYFKDMTTTKRVGVENKEASAKMATLNMTATCSNEDDPNDGLDAVPTMPLRLIDIMINDTLLVSGVLDSGCQIIVMRKDIWGNLCLPL